MLMPDDWLDKLFPKWPKIGKRKAESRKKNDKSHKSVTVIAESRGQICKGGTEVKTCGNSWPCIPQGVSFLALLQQVTGSPKVLNQQAPTATQ